MNLFRGVMPIVMLVAIGCAEVPTAPPDARTPAPDKPSLAVDLSITADSVTIYLRPRGAVRSNAKALLSNLGARRIPPMEFGGLYSIPVRVARSSLASFRELQWARIVEIDSSPPLHLTDASASIGRAARSYNRNFVELVPWGVFDIGAPQVHSTWANTGAGIKIAVLDNGIDCTSPDLAGRIFGGYDVVAGIATGCSTTDGQHGTPVAHILSAISNGNDIIGVAPGAQLYGYRACNHKSCDPADLYVAIWAAGVQEGVNIITASIANCGQQPNSETRSLISSLSNLGIVFVFAAGNGLDQEPCTTQTVSGYAALPETIGVGAYYSTGGYNSRWAQGAAIDISAPTDVESRLPGNTSNIFGGTSAATPHVAGAAALLLSAGFSGSQVKARLTETASDAGASGKDNIYGWGLLRVAAAAVPKARIDSLTWCTGTAINTPGSCAITAFTTNGIPTIEVRFEVTYSNSSSTVVYDWGSPSRTISVPGGDYTLTVKAIPRDQSYQRVGFHVYQDIPVCTGSQLLSTKGGASTNAVPGCGGGGGEEMMLRSPQR